jgi:hypothetical protein
MKQKEEVVLLAAFRQMAPKDKLALINFALSSKVKQPPLKLVVGGRS